MKRVKELRRLLKLNLNFLYQTKGEMSSFLLSFVPPSNNVMIPLGFFFAVGFKRKVYIRWRVICITFFINFPHILRKFDIKLIVKGI